MSPVQIRINVVILQRIFHRLEYCIHVRAAFWHHTNLNAISAVGLQVINFAYLKSIHNDKNTT